MITDTLRTFWIQKKEHENLFDYIKRFKTARDVANNQLRNPLRAAKYAKILVDWDKDDKEIKEEVRKKV